jgi:hypothetical protein
VVVLHYKENHIMIRDRITHIDMERPKIHVLTMGRDHLTMVILITLTINFQINTKKN